MEYQHSAKDRIDPSDYSSYLHSDQAPDSRGIASVWSRVFSLVVLLVLSPFLLVVGLLIVLGGQNPIFLQERVGYKGRTFFIFKFRTMPDEGWDAAEARAESSYLARIQLGLFRKISGVLRNTGLDEFPQFANILRGDMQVFGPRPLMMVDFLALPERRLERCDVLPGITGLAQVNGGQDLDSESKLALDLYMIRNPSYRNSARIVRQTILRIVGRSSATAKISEHDLELARRAMGEAATTERLQSAQARTSAVLATVLPLDTERQRRRMTAVRFKAMASKRQEYAEQQG